MKKLVLTLTVVLSGLFVFAQDFAAPKKGAKIYVESNSLEVDENDKVSFDIYLIKSKSARKATFENPKFLGPKGIEFEVTQDASDPTHYTVSAKADQIASGDYSVTVTGKRSGIHAVTGTILSLKVNPANSVASSDGE